MRHALAGLCAVLWASIAGAEPLDTADKFARYTAGKTLFFHLGDGVVYAAETYLRDARVRWSVGDGTCRDGRWWEERGLICFRYDDRPQAHCWAVETTPSGLKATLDDPEIPLVIFEVRDAQATQTCTGPKIGV